MMLGVQGRQFYISVDVCLAPFPSSPTLKQNPKNLYLTPEMNPSFFLQQLLFLLIIIKRANINAKNDANYYYPSNY